jgi:hypothetical protein
MHIQALVSPLHPYRYAQYVNVPLTYMTLLLPFCILPLLLLSHLL